MLKIKDNVDLKVLEKYGFEYQEGLIIKADGDYTECSTCININSREIFPYCANVSYLDYELIYDLTKDGLVEKVEEE